MTFEKSLRKVRAPISKAKTSQALSVEHAQCRQGKAKDLVCQEQ